MQKRTVLRFAVVILLLQALLALFVWSHERNLLDSTALSKKSIREEEPRCFCVNETWANRAVVPNSWVLGTVTRYSPHLQARCDLLWEGERKEVKRVQKRVKRWKNSRSDETFLQQLHNCKYVREMLNDNFYTSSVENDFPLAFLMTIHTYPQQVFRLLRVLYRPQNVYCIHVDAKARKEFIEAIESMSQCIPNILIPKHLVKVEWTLDESLLEAQLACLEVLYSTHKTWKWRYVLNICGTELPLQTNRQMVENLRGMNGTTYLFTDDFPESMKRIRFKYRYLPDKSGQPRKSHETFGTPPYNMKLYKSTTYSIMSYTFTDFILTHPKAIALRSYVKGARSAEEHFYITLFHLAEAPVGIAPYHTNSITSLWIPWWNSRRKCNSSVKHAICIAGVGTMKEVVGSATSHFFFNKYLEEVDHVIMDCAERRLVENNMLEFCKDCSEGTLGSF